MRTCLRYCHKSKWFSKAIRTSQIIDYCPLYGNNAYSINNDQCSPFTCNSSILSIRVTRGSLYLLPGNWYIDTIFYLTHTSASQPSPIWSDEIFFEKFVTEWMAMSIICVRIFLFFMAGDAIVLLAYESVCLSCVQYSIYCNWIF